MASKRPATTPQDLRDAVAQVRKQIEDLRAKLSKTDGEKRLPLDQAYARAEAWVDDLAEVGAVPAYYFSSPERSWVRIDRAEEVLGLLAWVDRDRLKERLRSAIDEHYAGFDGSLDTPETESAVQVMRTKLFCLEVEEEQIIRAAEAEGLRIARRGEADPLAVMSS